MIDRRVVGEKNTGAVIAAGDAGVMQRRQVVVVGGVAVVVHLQQLFADLREPILCGAV